MPIRHPSPSSAPPLQMSSQAAPPSDFLSSTVNPPASGDAKVDTNEPEPTRSAQKSTLNVNANPYAPAFQSQSQSQPHPLPQNGTQAQTNGVVGVGGGYSRKRTASSMHKDGKVGFGKGKKVETGGGNEETEEGGNNRAKAPRTEETNEPSTSSAPQSRRPPNAPSSNPTMIPITPSAPPTSKSSTILQDKERPRLVVVLMQACLETYKVPGSSGSAGGGGRGRKGDGGGDGLYTLLNTDDHQTVLKQLGRASGDARPDITHQVMRFAFLHSPPTVTVLLTRSDGLLVQCLMTLLDSPLNKSGNLQVYIQTAKGVLIEVNPSVRIPRTFKRFSGLMGALKSFP